MPPEGGKDNMLYSCGCEANGDNVANYCPIHGAPMLALPTGAARTARAGGSPTASRSEPDRDVGSQLASVLRPAVGAASEGGEPICTDDCDTCDFYVACKMLNVRIHP